MATRPDMLGNKLAFKHGMRNTTTYKSWQKMLERITSKTCKDYPDYGGRGITVTDPWRSFENFYADMGDKPKGYSLDRIDNAKGYSKANCRWATKEQQANNKRNNIRLFHLGITKTLPEWCQILNLPYNRVKARLYLGWPVKKALSA